MDFLWWQYSDRLAHQPLHPCADDRDPRRHNDIGSACSTPAYTYEFDYNGNGYATDPASPVQPPVFGDANVAFGIAVLLESAPASNS